MSKQKISAVLLGISLMFFADGCRKKGPAPPPPPKPRETVAEPPKAAPRPTIANFTADPTTIERGQSSTLRWTTSNAASASIDNGIGTVATSGSRNVSPNNTTTYRLSVRGDGGEASETVTVRVVDRPKDPEPSKPKPPQDTIDVLVARLVQDAYFDYDKSDIREDARAALQRNADALKNILGSTSGTIVIEGHCDERGSAEYNLGLGDRRSTSARDFLVQLGVPADRLKTVSYGKERPQCTDSNEGCYQKNRRAHFVGQQ